MNRVIFRNLANLYISPSLKLRTELVKLGFEIVHLPNGVDTNLFCPAGKKEDNLVLYVGRIAPVKSVHILLKSLKYIDASIKLVIIGPAGRNLTYFQTVLNNINKENNKGKHKIMYLGAQNTEKLVKWYRKASISVLVSYSEAFPMAILEALSCETPVIATKVGGVPEIVHDGENGFLITPNNVKQLAETIQYLLENKDRRKFGQEGRKLVLRHFSMGMYVNNLIKIYRNLV